MSQSQFPHMLIMRNALGGMIWQSYIVQNEQEVRILTKNARSNGFRVETEVAGYTTETNPGWRDTDGWKRCIEKDENEAS